MNEHEYLVNEIKNDFLARQKARRPYELAWLLNMNFYMGNQYSTISTRGIEQEDKYFFWQEKQVYNHIAPIVDTRLARLCKVRPIPIARPASADEKDVNSARLATKILKSAHDRLNISNVVSSCCNWSEVCGTAFMKVGWENTANCKVNDKVYSKGDVGLTVCPPFEIFPDSNVASELSDCLSLIHARAFTVEQIRDIWDVDVKGEKLTVFAFDDVSGVGGLGYNSTVPTVTEETKENCALVIERYTKPTAENPLGKLEIVAGDKLVYSGEMPYVLGVDGNRDYPFVRLRSIPQTGCFWGTSVIERLIPIQRAYNAVKNRKHEFMNRLAMGVLEVEDGSVDTDNLEEEGLSPGKILVYRQGAEKPQLMNPGNVPNDFAYEEQQLLSEFRTISGVSEFASTSHAAHVSSGTALSLLAEQDDIRMQCTADDVKNLIKQVAKYVLRLYKQFANSEHLCRISNDDGKVEVFYFKGSDLSSDDIVFDTENEITNSIVSRRAMVMDLLKMGVLSDSDGKLSDYKKNKILTVFGFGNWEDTQSLIALHVKKAQKENLDPQNAKVLFVDDHKVHIDEHTRFVISGESEKNHEKILEHIKEHQAYLEATNEQIQNGVRS